MKHGDGSIMLPGCFFFGWVGGMDGKKMVANTGSNTVGGCRRQEVRVEVHKAPGIQT